MLGLTMRVLALTFDAFGTIIDTGRAVLLDVANEIVTDYGLPMTGAEFLKRWDAHFFAVDHSEFLTLAEASTASLAKAFADLHVLGDPEPYVDSLLRMWSRARPYPEVRGVLAQLAGIPRAVVSNADDALLKDILSRNRLEFDAVVTSEACRAYKPAPRIFEVALRELGIAPQDTFHVGDSLDADVGGARNLGMGTVWVNRAGETRRPDQPSPNLEVPDLRGLLDTLRSLADPRRRDV